MAIITAGRFSYDDATSTLTGPQEYMRERGDARIREALSGRDAGFNALVMAAPTQQDPMLTFLVFLQTDYAGWVGARQLTQHLRPRREG